MDVGAQLRHAREERHLTVADLARITRISPRAIAAIEASRFGDLPGGIYTRGMLRTCAREVGLDPDRTVEAYRAQFEKHAPVEVRRPAVSARATYEIGGRLASSASSLGRAVDPTWYIVVAVILVGWILHRATEPAGQTPSGAVALVQTEPVPAATERAAAPDTPVGTGGVQQGDTNLPSAGGLRLEVKATARCWVSAVADSQQVLYRILEPGESETISANDALRLRIGNPAALTLTLNGRPVRPLGDGREPVTVRITPQNAADFAQP